MPLHLVESSGAEFETVAGLAAVTTDECLRLITGSGILDAMLGGSEHPGLALGASWFVTGVPGGGKSTLTLQVADALRRANGVRVFYISGEETKERVVSRSQRLMLEGDFGISDDLLDIYDICKFAVEKKIDVLVVDSIQKIKDADLSGPKLIKSVAEKLYALSKEFGIITIIIGQSLKNGKFAGPQSILHEFDMHLHITNCDKSNYRSFMFDKNRFGGDTFVDTEVRLSNCGFVFPDCVVVKKKEVVVEKEAGFFKKYFGVGK
jgi:DNA repair protein RadA/Sms